MVSSVMPGTLLPSFFALLEQELDQQRNVVTPLAQRRDLDGHDRASV